jgi:hypothetical protein
VAKFTGEILLAVFVVWQAGNVTDRTLLSIKFRKKMGNYPRRMRSAAFTPPRCAKRKPARYFQHLVVVDSEAG